MKLNFNPATKAGIETRLQNLKDRTEIDLAPKGLAEDFFSKVSRKELWEKYPERVRVYLKMKTVPEKLSAEDLKEIEKQKSWITALNNLGNYIKEHKTNGGILEDLQIEVFEAVHNFLETGNKRGKIVIPTGVGKTVIFSQIIRAMKLRSLIAVPTKDLTLQTETSMRRFAKEVTVGKVFTAEKDFGRDVTVTTYKSGKENKDFDFNNYGLAILDEAHKALTSATQEMILKLEEAGAIILEFTATDEYSEDKKIESREIFRLKTKEAIEQGLLCGVSCVVAKLDIDMSDYLVRTNDGYNADLLEKGIKKYAVYDKAAEMYIKSFNGENAFMKCASIAGAEDAAKIANTKKKKDGTFVKAVAIHSGLSDEKRKQILEDCIPSESFPNGKYDILCGVGLIETGLDLPHFSVLLNLEPRFSIIPVAQAGGRVLRLDRRNEDKYAKHATVVDFLFNDNSEVKSGSKSPILYAEYLGSTYVLPEKSPKNKRREKNNTDEYEIGLDEVKENITLENLQIDGLEIIIESEEIMKVVRGLRESDIEIEKPLPGWMTVKEVCDYLRTNSVLIREYARKNLNETKEFKKQSQGGKIGLYLSPGLIKKIEAEINRDGFAPEGWVSGLQIKENLGLDYRTIENNCLKFLASGNVNVVKDLKSPVTYKVSKHYSPEFIKFLEEKYLEVNNKIAPDGWVTVKVLADRLGGSRNLIYGRLEKAELSEDFAEGEIGSKYYHEESGKQEFFLSPKFQKWVEESFQSAERPPVGWHTNKGLSTRLEVGQATIQSIANQYMKDEKYVKQMIGKTGPTPHYSPLLCKIIAEQILSMRLRLGRIARSEFEKRLQPFIDNIQESAAAYTDADTKKIKQSAKEKVKNTITKKDPNTWKSLEELAVEINTDLSKLQKIMDTKIVGAAHVKEEFLNDKKIKLLSPALQDVIKDEIK